MADIKISQLGAAQSVNDADVLPMTANGTTVKVSAEQLKEHAIGDTDISDIGDGTPTGAIAHLDENKANTDDLSDIADGNKVVLTDVADGDEITYDGTTQKWKNTSKIQSLTNQVDDIKENYQSVKLYHNIPRLVPKDMTRYITDGTLYKRLNGTDGFALFEDIYVGDYIHMSRAISAKEITGQYQITGSDYVTIAAIDWYLGNGDTAINYHHLVMVPGKGFEGTQHFGRSRMNSTNDTTGGYTSSEMHTTTIGAVASSGSTASDATINQQLYAEFGSHLKTTRELLSNAMDSTRTNRFGQATGATSGWAWASCQAVLMSEIEVYGSIVFSSAGQDTGNACAQLPLFAHSKQAINNRSGYYWLKDVASAANFCRCHGDGIAGYTNASGAHAYVRPRFILA